MDWPLLVAIAGFPYLGQLPDADYSLQAPGRESALVSDTFWNPRLSGGIRQTG